jgi:predicted nucleic acid-binding protein
MSVKAFIDTNIFVYAQRTDDSKKRQIAEDAIDYFNCVASTQVLNEISNVFTKKYPMPAEKVEYLLRSISEISEIVVVDEQIIYKALYFHKRYVIPYYDCLMIAAAVKAECQLLISEDIQDSLIVENSLKIVNIFQHTDSYIIANVL